MQPSLTLRSKNKELQGMKASAYSRKRPKIIEWKEKRNSRGTKFIPVDVTQNVSTSLRRSQQIQGQDAGKIQNTAALDEALDEATLHKFTPQSMDVDGLFWMDEVQDPIPEKKRVSKPVDPSSAIFDILFSQSVLTSMNLFLGLTRTCGASLTLKALRLLQIVRAACLLHSSGGALIAFLLLRYARIAAERPTSGFPFTESRSGQENTLFHHGCGRLG
jgi:hypothetical protein